MKYLFRNKILWLLIVTLMVIPGCTVKELLKVSSEPNIIIESNIISDEKSNTIEEPQTVQEHVNNNLIEITPVEGTDVTEGTEVTAEIHFIAVGQADSILIVTPNKKSILVDAGESKAGTEIISTIKSLGLTEIDLIVATHPHADHIGGMESVIKEFNVKEIMMSSHIATTKTFESLLDEIANQGKKITQAKLGLTREIDGVVIEVLGVDTLPKDSNNSSIVLKVTYGETDIIMTGDTESKAEQTIINNVGNKLDAEILKVGHHGSDTSTSDKFVDAVSPDLAVISVGEGNKYNHPSQSILNKLINRNTTIYRTDLNGAVIIKTDGNKIEVETETNKESTPVVKNESSTGTGDVVKHVETNTVEAQVVSEEVVYKTKTGTKYHKDGCSSLSKSKIETTIKDAVAVGLGPCSKCN